jgi:hypothetical protein
MRHAPVGGLANNASKSRRLHASSAARDFAFRSSDISPSPHATYVRVRLAESDDPKSVQAAHEMNKMSRVYRSRE